MVCTCSLIMSFGLIHNCLSNRDQSYYRVSSIVVFRKSRSAHLCSLPLGHERSLTQIKFNAEGDLLFSCSKDHVINVWFSHNGERLGTYDGNNGTVWTLDVDGAACFPSHYNSILNCLLVIVFDMQSRANS